MSQSIAAFRLDRRLVVLLVTLATAAAFILSASPAFAFHCYVENKPNGAGSVTEEDLKVAGNSGKVVAPGAFIDTSETGLEHDLFIRGQPVPQDDEDEFIVGLGTLPSQPHDAGNTSNGVQALEFEFPEE